MSVTLTRAQGVEVLSMTSQTHTPIRKMVSSLSTNYTSRVLPDPKKPLHALECSLSRTDRNQSPKRRKEFGGISPEEQIAGPYDR